jgi:MFS family permease
MEPQATRTDELNVRLPHDELPATTAKNPPESAPADFLSSNAEAKLAASARRKAYLRIVLPLFITSIIAYLDRINVSYAALTMNEDLGFTDEMFGFGVGIFFAGYVLFEIPGALIAERYSPKWWLARIMVSWGILTGLLPFITAPWHFYVLRFLIGAAEASLYPVIYASVMPRWFCSADRPRAIAFMLASLQVSSIIGAPLAGWLLGVPIFDLKGWQVLFLLEAIPALVFGSVLAGIMSDWPKDAAWLTPQERQFLARQYEDEMGAKATARHFTVWQALSDKEVLRLCGTYFLWMTGYWGFNSWMPKVLSDASGWSNLAVGWMIVVPMSLSLVVMLWVGHHSSRTGEKRWHGAGGPFLAAAGMLLGTTTDNSILAFVCMCMAAIGVYAALGVWWSYPTTFLSGAAAAGAAGLINSVGSTGGFVGPYLTGFLKDLTGTYTSAWLFLAFSLACAGCLMLTFRQRTAGEKM